MVEPEKEETQFILDVPPGYQEEERLDVYVTGKLANVTRAKVQKGIREGRVEVNGKAITRVSHRIQANDHIVCTVLRPPPIEAAPEAIPIEVVFEDEYLLVVNKEAGMVVHPAYGNRTGTLVNALLHHLGAATVRPDATDATAGLSTLNMAAESAEGFDLRPGIVHRLDKDTSGLLVVAKNDAVHAHLAKQFAQRTINRQYKALIWGSPIQKRQTISTHLARDPRDRKKVAVVPEGKGKHAITHLRVVEDFGYTSLAAFQLETGRTHQIRIHARHINHPIVGDETYGGATIYFGPRTGTRKAFFRKLFDRLQRQALHAETLGFKHPVTGKQCDFEAPVPEDMAYAIERMRNVDALR